MKDVAPRKSRSYSAGDWFRIPLGLRQHVAEWKDKWALGLAARTAGRGIVLAYFFGPFERPPTFEDCHGRTPADGVPMVIGDHALDRREWEVLGRLPNWSAAAWPSPFYGVSMGAAGAKRISFAEDGSLHEQHVAAGLEARRLPVYSIVGSDLVAADLRTAFEVRARRTDDD